MKNGSSVDERACLEYSDNHPKLAPDGRFDTLRVCVRRQSPGVFSKLAGLDFIYISASATAAVVYRGSPIPANFIALNPTKCGALEVGANDLFKVEGPIWINSECDPDAGVFGCNIQCEALSGIDSVGGVKMDSSCNPCEVTAIPHFEDPLRDLLPPCFPNSPVPCEDVGFLAVRHGTPANPEALKDGANLQPGIYYGGIEISDGSMAPGIYIMAGGGFKVNSNDNFKAKGVFIYNTNDPDCLSCSIGAFKPVIINTNGEAEFSPMTTGPYAGLLFFQDRANTDKAVFNTNKKFGEGTVYFPSAHVDLNPNDDVTIQIISDTIKVNNNAKMTARWDGDHFYQAPSARIALTG